MKKRRSIIIILLIIGVILIGFRFKRDNKILHNENSNTVENSIIHKNKLKDNDYETNSDKYSTYNGVPFNKGYNNNYDKAAVEKANKEHSKVKFNDEFKVYGVDNVPGAINATYVRDVDGDTLIANIEIDEKTDGKNESIRFYGIDSSEDVNPKIHCVEPYSVQAKNFVEGKLHSGDKIKILLNKNKGKYGRYVGTIYYNNNGKWYNLNEEEVANGLARIAYLDKNNNNINKKNLYVAENSAKNQKLNIWSIPNYVTPYGYNLAIFK